MTDDGFTWTRHVEHGGFFRCPDEALGDMAGRGWVVCDPPEPPNPATAEQLALRAAAKDESGRQITTTAARRGSLDKE
jgi:hypothetical protein